MAIVATMYVDDRPVIYGTNSDRLALAQVAARTLFHETDTKLSYTYDGTGWVITGAQGSDASVLISPTGTPLGSNISPFPVIDANFTAIGVKQIAALSAVTATALPDVTAMIAAGANIALIQSLTHACRWSMLGTDPTSSFGIQIAAGETYLHTLGLSGYKLISLAGGSEAQINVVYMKS